MLRVLLVSDTNKQTDDLRATLLQSGCNVVADLASTLMTPQQVAELQVDVVIINTKSPNQELLQHMTMLTQDEPRPVVMVSEDTQPATIKAAINAGVSAYVVEPIESQRLSAVLEVAQARFEQNQVLMQQVRQAESKLNERKVVERAKGLLMQLRSMPEADAYHAMRKMAMDRNIRIIDVAQKLLSMNELLA